MEYCLKSYLSENELFQSFPLELDSFHWEADVPYRPKTVASIGIVGSSLVAAIKCYEENPRAVYDYRDAPVYNDSCLELFVAPLSLRDEYVNVECNSRGTFLCEFGNGKYNRRLVADFTKSSPVVESFVGKDANGSYWGVKIGLSRSFVADVYDVDEACVDFDVVRLNIYKCGDECHTQHYLAFSPVTTLPPGFHNPECFATFKKEI